MAMAAAPYLHARLSTIDATLSPAVAEPEPKPTSVAVEFIVPGARHPEMVRQNTGGPSSLVAKPSASHLAFSKTESSGPTLSRTVTWKD
jgi:hypothetical protein